MEITSREINEAWQVLCSVYHSRGIDLRKLLNEAGTSKPKWLLKREEYKANFEKLHNAGCSEVALLIALWVIRSAPSWSNTWRVVVGQKRARTQLISALEKAASALEVLLNSFDVVLSRHNSLAKSETVPAKANVSQLAPEVPNELSSIPAPHELIRALRTYSRVLKGFDEAAKRTKIHSPEAFGRYLISELVKASTGEFHDKEVSALIGGALGEARYDEVAHRNWRFRNYKQIQAVSFPVELLIGFSLIIALNA